jgi:hypothetical protein
MLTPAVFACATSPGVELNPICVIWKRSKGSWDYLCRAPLFEVERIVWLDRHDQGTAAEDYEVRRG